MLGDAAFPQFYPTVFVLVTEMLDHFGAPVLAPAPPGTAPHYPAPPLTTRHQPSPPLTACHHPLPPLSTFERSSSQAAAPCDAGELVYARVHAKGQATGKTLREGFAPSEVLEEGVETTKNWFYKVASIRELVPRFYVELAILKCYRLLLPPEQIVTNVRRMPRPLGPSQAQTQARA